MRSSTQRLLGQKDKIDNRHNNKSYKITNEIGHRFRVWTAEEESESWS